MHTKSNTRRPPLLIGAALLFWGWLAEFLIPAIIVATILEGARLVKFRWPFDFADFRRVTILCDIFIVVVILLINTNQSIGLRGVLFIQWLPLIAAPLVIAQFYSEKGQIYLWSLFLTFGKTKDQKPKLEPLVDLSYPFLILCVLSASAANKHDWHFYGGVLILAAWALWGGRSKRHSIILWGGLLLLGALIGHYGAVGLHQLQTVLENKMLNWYLQRNHGDADPYRSSTAIGDIGELKWSGKILFRVYAASRPPVPLLRETSYNIYHFSSWYAKKAVFKKLPQPADGQTWMLQSQTPSDALRIMVAQQLRRGKGLLKLPAGAFKITHLPALQMATNPYGAVRVEDGPDLASYSVYYHPLVARDAPPEEGDLTVPQMEAEAIDQIHQTLKLAHVPESQKLIILRRFFYNHFKYTLRLKKAPDNSSPLANFLLRTRAGHCEYFATSTVLLLRAAGIPARYATGYLVDEYSRLEKCFVVRTRHAHAWALAYINGRWQNFDTTPPLWPGIEADNAPHWQPVSDVLAWAWFKFSQWRAREGGRGIRNVWLWLLAPLILYLSRRLIFKQRVKRQRAGKTLKIKQERQPGADSSFYHISEYLHLRGFTRRTGETLTEWLKRLDTLDLEAKPDIHALHPIIKLHYRLRFDPKGISPADQVRLKSKVDNWLEKNSFRQGSRQ